MPGRRRLVVDGLAPALQRTAGVGEHALGPARRARPTAARSSGTASVVGHVRGAAPGRPPRGPAPAPPSSARRTATASRRCSRPGAARELPEPAQPGAEEAGRSPPAQQRDLLLCELERLRHVRPRPARAAARRARHGFQAGLAHRTGRPTASSSASASARPPSASQQPGDRVPHQPAALAARAPGERQLGGRPGGGEVAAVEVGSRRRKARA